MFQKTLLQNERFNSEEDKKIDVYAYAITLYEIATRMDAWDGIKADDIQNQVIKGHRPEFNDLYRGLFSSVSGFTTMIEECWDEVPKNRPTFEEIELRLSRLSRTRQVNEETTRTLYSLTKTNGSTGSSTN